MEEQVERHVDALVVGAGPAGAVAALNLAPTRSVLLIDYRSLPAPGVSVGESLAPAARRLFGDMGLLDSFLGEGHAPCYGNRSVWGSETIRETDLMRDPDGHGWHLGRARFDAWLRDVAIHRGASLRSSVTVQSVQRRPSGEGWLVALSHRGGETIAVCARALIDATGRFATLARRLGAETQSDEHRMVCSWQHGFSAHETAATAGFTGVEAEERGWWYTAPLPNGRRILAFHTDTDLLASTAPPPFMADILRECGFSAKGAEISRTVAHGGLLYPAAGPGWFAAGDAAIHFDPLSSQGLLNALFTGLASAEAVDRALQGEESAQGYNLAIAGIRDAYMEHRASWYGSENRWPDAPFWKRRHADSTKAA